MTTKSRINKIRDKIRQVLTSPTKEWFKKTINKSVKLRILNKKLHDLEVSKTRGK